MISWCSGTSLGTGQWQFGFQILMDKVLPVVCAQLDCADEMWRRMTTQNLLIYFSQKHVSLMLLK